jgi:hypothetical protein
MGTSAARRGPRGPRWSLARRAATRYLAGEESGLPAVRELAARYVAALEETALEEGRDLLGAFRLTRKVAQNLGDFLTPAPPRGWGGGGGGGGGVGGGGGGGVYPGGHGGRGGGERGRVHRSRGGPHRPGPGPEGEFRRRLPGSQ